MQFVCIILHLSAHTGSDSPEPLIICKHEACLSIALLCLVYLSTAMSHKHHGVEKPFRGDWHAQASVQQGPPVMHDRVTRQLAGAVLITLPHQY